MDQPVYVGPMQITFGEGDVMFRFADPLSMTLEIPPSFEEQVREVVEEYQSSFEGHVLYMDLGNLPAISSRQLGMILTVREVLKSVGTLQLTNVSGSVRHLLKITGTERFFDAIK